MSNLASGGQENESNAASTVNRRRLIQGAVVGAGAVWAAPSVLSIDAAHAATINCGVPAFTGPISSGTLTAGDNLNAFGLGGTQNSDTTMFLFLERSAITAPVTFTPDVGAIITAGTRICSWILHHSPITGTTPQRKTGTVTFGANKIIGFDHRDFPPNTSLDARDGTYGFPGVTYPTGVQQRKTNDGGETGPVPPGDILTPSGASPFTSLFIDSYTTAGFVDQVRIYTTSF